MIGKTIARIEVDATDPQFGYARADTILIHFTDGTAMRVVGRSYEDVTLDYDEVDFGEISEYEHAAQGRREKERLARLEREEWLAAGCEERTRRRKAKRAGMGAFALAMDGMIQEEYMSMVVAANRFGFGSEEREVRYSCKSCGERECENAEVRTIKAPSQADLSSAAYSSIPIEPKESD